METHTFKTRESHLGQVGKLQETLRQGKQTVSLKVNSGANSLRKGAYKTGKQLDLSDFKAIIEFNPEEMWITVEPKITFEELCTFTLRHDLIPPVVPEFKTITVGGAVMGASLESSSYSQGQVNDNCLEYEILLGNGELVKASPSQHSDLFYGCAGSYGTLGIVTLIKLKLVRAKKWVKLTYHRFNNANQAVNMLTSPLQDQFAEGIIYSPKEAVVITANMEDSTNGGKIFSQNRSWSPWYVQHVQKTENREEYMSLKNYLFRLDRGGFWIGRYIHSFWTVTRLVFNLGIPKIKQGSFSPSFLFRLLFGWCFSSKRLYRIWHKVPNHIAEKLFFIHDFYTPFSKAQESLSYFVDKTGIYPIWICPIKGVTTPQLFSPHFGTSNYLDIGVYGSPQVPGSVPEISSACEKQILLFGGRKMLYSFTYYDEETFSKYYDIKLYKELRKRYFAEDVFPSLYNKIINKSKL